MSYKYITDNNLYEKQNYMYSEYNGIAFIKDYINSRQEYLNKIIVGGYSETISCDYEVGQDLKNILNKLKKGCTDHETIALVNAYTKSFEVRKRIYTNYDDKFKPYPDAGFENYETYLLFAECLLLTYKQTRCMKYFSCMLKLDDTLLSVSEKLNDSLKSYLCRIIHQELDCFYQLAKENEISVEVES